MKQIILTFVLLISVTAAIGQNKGEVKIDYFVDQAKTEFKLDKKQTKELRETRTTYVEDYRTIMKKVKNGEIAEDQKKPEANKLNQQFNKDFAVIAGVEPKDLQPFLKRMREEMKSL